MPKTQSNTELARVDALADPSQGTPTERLNAYLATIPTVQEDPTETMLEAILQSETPDQWDRVFTAASFKDQDKAQLRILDFRPSESQFVGGLRYFLVLDVVDLRSGVRGVMTCGSTMAMAQIVNAARRGTWPLDVEVVRKPTPTKNGFHPMHLHYIGGTEAPIGDPTKVVAEQ